MNNMPQIFVTTYNPGRITYNDIQRVLEVNRTRIYTQYTQYKHVVRFGEDVLFHICDNFRAIIHTKHIRLNFTR